MIRIENLKKTFGARTLFEQVSYHFPTNERLALVGANGAGKTTLLNIICGLDEADNGKILVPGDTQLGYLPQKPNPDPKATVLEECQVGAKKLAALRHTMDDALAVLEHDHSPEAMSRFEQAESEFRRQGGYAVEASAHGILRGLGFTPDDIQKDPKNLSGGWRMRLELAKLFLGRPDFLILDEPTNHLDLPSLVWVESYLMSFRGTLLFVSHDKELLNRLSTMTLHLSGSTLTPYRGNFDQFLEQRDARMEQEAAVLGSLRRRRESMEQFVTRFGAKASKATQAQSRVKMIARIRDLEQQVGGGEVDNSSVSITLPPPAKTPRIVYTVEGGAVGYAKPLSRGIQLTIERGMKVAIIGANGIGKSTFLKTVAGELPKLAGKFAPGDGVPIAYFAQDQGDTLDLNRTVLQNLLQESEVGEKEARNLLGHFLFRGDDVFKEARVLSGGELSRLGLACALARRAGILLLDEPTNHLDMASVEALAACLAEYEGTVLFVSHDRHFIEEVATHIFAMLPDGRSSLFEGKLADYVRLAKTAGFPNVLEAGIEGERALVREGSKPPTAANATPAAAAPAAPAVAFSDAEIKELKRVKQKAATRVEQLDKELARLKSEAVRLEAALAALAPSDFGKARFLHEDQLTLQKKAEMTEEEWLLASEEVEAVNAKLAASGRQV